MYRTVKVRIRQVIQRRLEESEALCNALSLNYLNKDIMQ